MVAICLILALMAVPLWVVARQRSEQQVCLARLKRVGQLLARYHQQHGRYPAAATWASDLRKFGANEADLHCPTAGQTGATTSNFVYLLDGDQLAGEDRAPSPEDVILYCPAHARRVGHDTTAAAPIPIPHYRGAFPALRLNQTAEVIQADRVQVRIHAGKKYGPGWSAAEAYLDFPK